MSTFEGLETYCFTEANGDWEVNLDIEYELFTDENGHCEVDELNILRCVDCATGLEVDLASL